MPQSPPKPAHTPQFLALCASVTAKRPKTVIDHLLQHGHITTEELKTTYGYDHPPRAARDVREHGIALETFSVIGPNGRKIAAYRFGAETTAAVRKLSGRTGLSKKIKEALVEKYGCRCFIYLEAMEAGDLQIDHRVPYEVDGDGAEPELRIDDFMLLCGSANRAKSWSCEHCENWKSAKDKSVCLSCYWASPENYTHIGMRQIRRIDLVWQGSEIAQYEQLQKSASALRKEIPQLVKEIIAKELRRKPPR